MPHVIRNLFILLSLVVLAGSIGCTQKDQGMSPDEQAAQNAANRIRELEDQLAQAQRDREANQDEINRLKAELDKLRGELAKTPTDWHSIPGGAMLSIEGTVLFDSGKADLKPGGRQVLAQAASAISQNYPNHDVYVFGHTDNQPIKFSNWKDNYELSCQRALTVLRTLRSLGVRSSIGACGWGQDRPVADNNTDPGRQSNRRVEIYAMEPQQRK